MSYDHRYRTVEREIRGKMRTLLIPDAGLKLKQQDIIPFFEALPVSANAFAYIRQRSLYQAVSPHFGKQHVTTMDIREFFQSITSSMIFSALHGRCSYHRAKEITSLVTYKGYLPFGAPSSPAVSNFIFYPVDVAIVEFCNYVGINYTRYADDLIFSYDNSLTGRYLLTEIAKIIARFGFRLNLAKTKYNPNFVLGIKILYPANVVSLSSNA